MQPVCGAGGAWAVRAGPAQVVGYLARLRGGRALAVAWIPDAGET